MSYELSFSEDFFTGTESLEDMAITDQPTSVLQAILSWFNNEPDSFNAMVKDVLGIDMPDYLPETLPYELLEKIREVDTCSNIDTPVSVWLDPEGYHTVEVYDVEPEEPEDYPEDNMTDVEADADTLASAGWGTDEDYGCFGGEEW